ncbi:poly(A) RNA polymerase, mitochondrial isoform X2 [Vanacampus margaritifer]
MRRTSTKMASSIAAHRVHMSGRSKLVQCLQKVDRVFHRRVGTTAVAAHADPPTKDEAGEKDGRLSFYAVQAQRQKEAERSVLINCPQMTNKKKILKFLSLHGDIKKYFTYESYGIHAVVEFASQDSVYSLLDAASIPSNNHESLVPYKSRLMTLRYLTEVTSQQSSKETHSQTTIPINDLIMRLCQEESIDQQIVSLTEAYQLTEENSRLRFLVCSMLKDIAAAYFPECSIKPFGSSVNGFGKLGCDLDMFLDLDGISGRNLKMPPSGMALEYQMKRASSERSVTQSLLSVIGECVDQFGPGCVGVQKILNARCPLVRFSHQPSGFQCDLTANNRVAMKSSELLYLYGQLDPRVRHLVFTVRCWARAKGVTSSIPGAWITNFSLTVMVVFFLQGRSPSIIPTLDHLRNLAGPADKSVIEGNDCTFVSDFDRIQLQSNTETLEKLLCEFFEFYGSFEFIKKSINIRKGKEQNKPEACALHIQNPFETALNVSKNVNHTQLERFVDLCKEGAWLLQQSDIIEPKRGRTPQPWGLASLLLPAKGTGGKSQKKWRKELPNVRIKSLLESLKKKNSRTA